MEDYVERLIIESSSMRKPDGAKSWDPQKVMRSQSNLHAWPYTGYVLVEQLHIDDRPPFYIRLQIDKWNFSISGSSMAKRDAMKPSMV